MIQALNEFGTKFSSKPAQVELVVDAKKRTGDAYQPPRGRPTAFELDAAGLEIRWPLRSQRIAAGDIAGADLLSRESFRRDFGWGMRIGAGGLWGGFGWLYTRRGLVDLYVSRTDRFVLVRRRAGRPLLLTPERDESFVDALRALSRG